MSRGSAPAATRAYPRVTLSQLSLHPPFQLLHRRCARGIPGPSALPEALLKQMVVLPLSAHEGGRQIFSLSAFKIASEFNLSAAPEVPFPSALRSVVETDGCASTVCSQRRQAVLLLKCF